MRHAVAIGEAVDPDDLIDRWPPKQLYFPAGTWPTSRTGHQRATPFSGLGGLA